MQGAVTTVTSEGTSALLNMALIFVCPAGAVWQPRRRRRRRRHQPGAPADPQLVEQLADMGFDREQVSCALSPSVARHSQNRLHAAYFDSLHQ
jgi:hypothetical protein